MHKQEQAAWWVCEGAANRPTVSRRDVLQGGMASALAVWLAGQGSSAIAQTLISPHGHVRGDVFIILFLRGGADGLSIVVPHGDDNYYKKRPTLALPKPRKGGVTGTASRSGAAKTEPGAADTAVDLDGFFGIHPALGALFPLYADGLLAPLHAVGSGDQTRSHFEAMATMERGLSGEEPNSGAASGWLARHLANMKTEKSSPLRAVAWGEVMPDSLRGATDVTVLRDLAEYRLQIPDAKNEPTVHQTLAKLYGAANGAGNAVEIAGRATLSTLDALKRLDANNYKPAHGAVYPQTELGNGFRQTACLIKGEVGLEAVALDRGGWDTHVGQGGSVGWMSLQLQDVGDSLAAFARDLGQDGLRRVTVVIMTEFGRRVEENGGLGTDHGRASAMLVMGGGIRGGKVYAKWPGLTPDKLDSVGDMRVTTDYRTVLAEIARTRLLNPHADTLFPGLAGQGIGLTKPG